MEHYVCKDNKKLRYGYTTGSCAAAAARRAAEILLGAEVSQNEPVKLSTPKGIDVLIPVVEIEVREDWVRCAVKKDAGDDPDATDGIIVHAKVTKSGNKCSALNKQETADELQIAIIGGIGVGRVTKAGLACSVGEAAINPVPSKMIEHEVRITCEEFEYKGKLIVEISVPEGVEIAKKTYNPRLGIEGGISILGTSGIVEPMSEKALIDTIKVEMNVRKANGAEYIVITPGNYGETFIKNKMEIEKLYTVKCSNYIGEALDYAESSKLKGVLLVGHIGKFVKVAAGIMNTHSKYGDARLETLCAHAGVAGASRETMEKLLSCITTDEAIAILDETGIREETINSILKKLEFHIKERVHHNLEIGAVMFSNKYGYLGQTENVEGLLNKLKG